MQPAARGRREQRRGKQPPARNDRGKICRAATTTTAAAQSAAQDGNGGEPAEHPASTNGGKICRRRRPPKNLPRATAARRTRSEATKTAESAGDQPNKGSNPNHLPRQSGQQPPARTTCQEISNSGAAYPSTAAQRRGRLSQPEEPTAEDDKPARRDQGGSTRSPCQS